MEAVAHVPEKWEPVFRTGHAPNRNNESRSVESPVVILFPAIDIKDGACVRLEQGDMKRATVFHHDPAAQASAFEAQGFEFLHVVDLDGAFAGKPMNARAIDRILESVGIPVQLGGGIRDLATIEGWLGKGVNRVIIGTAAVRDPELVRRAAALTSAGSRTAAVPMMTRATPLPSQPSTVARSRMPPPS